MTKIILKNKVSNWRFYYCFEGQSIIILVRKMVARMVLYTSSREVCTLFFSQAVKEEEGSGDTENIMGFETSMAIPINMNIFSPLTKYQLHQGILNFPRQFTHWGLSMQIYENMGIILIQTNTERILTNTSKHTFLKIFYFYL